MHSREVKRAWPQPLLEVIDLGKRYGSILALEKVSFRVEEGEMFGLLGPKRRRQDDTSVDHLRAAVGDGGRGAPGWTVARFGWQRSRRDIGIVPQELAVYGELTGRENLQFFGELYGLRGRKLKGRVDGVLEAVGLADRADQRCALTRGA